MNQKDEAGPRSNRQAQSNQEIHLNRCIERLVNCVGKLDSRAERIASYFLQIDKSCVATQRVTKHRLAERLRKSLLKPQIVAVQGRGSKKGSAYLIMPLELAAEMLEARIEEQRFVPITETLRKIGGTVEIGGLKRLGSGRPRLGDRLRGVKASDDD